MRVANGLAPSGWFVRVRSAWPRSSRRLAMNRPVNPKAPVMQSICAGDIASLLLAPEAASQQLDDRERRLLVLEHLAPDAVERGEVLLDLVDSRGLSLAGSLGEIRERRERFACDRIEFAPLALPGDR